MSDGIRTSLSHPDSLLERRLRGDGLRSRNLLLAALSGLLLALSFPPVPTGILAFVAFVPLFTLLETVESYGRTFRYAYVAFFVFNAGTLYWTGGFTHGRDPYLMAAGGLLLLAHPFFFVLPVLAWSALRRRFGFTRSLAAFPFFWVGFEYLHSLTQVSFPWILVGNSQSYDLAEIQFIEWTGVYALSFWVILLNLLVYLLLRKVRSGRLGLRSLRAGGALASILVLSMLPRIYGALTLRNGDPQFPAAPGGEAGRRTVVRVGIVQPDIDPFEKWQNAPDYSLDILKDLTRRLARDSVDLVLWPETAIPFYILHPSNRSYFLDVKREIDSLDLALLTGIPDTRFYGPGEGPPPPSSKTAADGRRYDSYNSSMLLIPRSAQVQRYAKMFLVPFAERVPLSDALSFLNAARWNFGLGGWAIGRDSTVFRFPTAGGREVRFSNLICYESIYPGFVASFVRKGAEFLTVITNDSWWGNTSGAYQHRQFAVLRAVENRRWVVQCANGGISCIVDPAGRIVKSSSMFTQGVLAGEIGLRDDLTFYAAHGDWFAEFCLVLSIFALGAGASAALTASIRTRGGTFIHPHEKRGDPL